MAHRELIVLGTSSQVPTRHRNHNGYFLRWGADGFLFDPGEGTQRQMVHAGLSASQITRICITHFHGDHSLGLAGIIQRLSLDRVPEVHVFYPASGQQFFERLRYSTSYLDCARLVPHPIEDSGVVFRTDRYILEAARLDHSIDCFGYRLQEHDGYRLLNDRLEEAGVVGPLAGAVLRQGSVHVGDRLVRLDEVSEPRPGQAFAFVMDTRPCDGARRLAHQTDLLVCESTFLESEREEAHAYGHMTARQAAELARDAGARRLVLTHFSQRYDDVDAFVREAAEVHEDVVAAQDLGVIEVPARRRVETA